MGAIAEVMRRPQPVTVPMVALFSLIPLYLFIGDLFPGRTLHKPQTFLDDFFPLRAEWSVVYGSLFLAALLPVFVIHQQELVRRTINAFLATWLTAYAFFIAYPTVGMSSEDVAVDGFFSWALRLIYTSDTPYNCFPSLHVAQCFLAAFACHRVHRGVGAVAGVWAFLVALSTLYTKQHYVLDALGGVLLACVAYAIFLRGYPRGAVPQHERQLAPVLALCALGAYGIILVILVALYTFADRSIP